MTTRFNMTAKSIVLSLALIGTTGLSLAQSSNVDVQPSKAPIQAEKIHSHHKGCGVFKTLGLTDAQKQALKTQHQAFRQENATLISDMKSKFQELKQLPDTPENKAQRDTLRAELKQDRQTLRGKHLAMMKQVLTPEQFQKYEVLKKQCKQEWRKTHPQKEGTV